MAKYTVDMQPAVAPESPRRGRGRPATPAEQAEARRIARRLAAARADAVAWARDHADIRQTETAELLGVDRMTVRAWQRPGPAPEGEAMHVITETSRDYWSVETPEGKSLGDVLGGGPTRDTRFKAISPNDAAKDPEVAPGACFRTLDEAAAHLAR